MTAMISDDEEFVMISNNDRVSISLDEWEEICVNDEGVPYTRQNDPQDTLPRSEDLISSKNTDQVESCCGKVVNREFFKGCKWSPDVIGNRILTCDGSNKLTIFHTFLNKLDYRSSQISDDKYEIRNIGNVYDYDWFPLASESQYYVVAATSLGPIHIFDALNSKSIASYHMYNTNDEMIYAHSVACAPDGSGLISGTSDYLFRFDINRPGKNYERILTRENFNRGIISTIDVNPIRSSMFAIGTYNNRVGIYDDNYLLCVLCGHTKGVSYVKFSPDGLLLYTGARGNGDIICWDLRRPGKGLYKLQRAVKTQQRIYFDITSNSRFILSGSTNGEVHIWDSLKPPVNHILHPVHTFLAHQDCTNGLSVHTRLPFIATASGQYHYSVDDSYEGDVDEDVAPEENTLKLWHIDL